MKNNIIKFLLGEDSFDGVWFGEKHPTEQGVFWWRKHLRQHIEQNKALRIPAVFSHSRKRGKTLDTVIAIKAALEQGGRVGVFGCEDPRPILDRLKELGINVIAEPMIKTQPLKAVYETDGFEEYISGFDGGEKKQIGFIFCCG
jgi:hypothetical protein